MLFTVVPYDSLQTQRIAMKVQKNSLVLNYVFGCSLSTITEGRELTANAWKNTYYSSITVKEGTLLNLGKSQAECSFFSQL